MAEDSVLYAAVYSDADTARADLDAFEELHKAGMIGTYDAAVIDMEGTPGRTSSSGPITPPSG